MSALHFVLIKNTNIGVAQFWVQILLQLLTGNFGELFAISETLLLPLTMGMSTLRVEETTEHSTGL